MIVKQAGRLTQLIVDLLPALHRFRSCSWYGDAANDLPHPTRRTRSLLLTRFSLVSGTIGVMSNVVLIRPASVTTLRGMGDDAVAPLGIAYLAAALERDGHSVTVIDACGAALGQYAPVPDIPGGLRHGLQDDEIIQLIPADADLIGFSIMFSLEWLTTRLLAHRVRAKFPEVFIVAGGEHATAMPEYVLSDCDAFDACVLGEGEQTLTDLAHILATGGPLEEVGGLCLRTAGGIVLTGQRPRIRELGGIPNPAWHLIPIEKYLDNHVMSGIDFGRSMPIMASRGCPYKCTFCSNPVMWGPLWRVREPGEVVDEMVGYTKRYGATNFDFYDLTAIVKRGWTVEFCKRIIADGLKITWQFPSGTRSEALDAEVTKLLSASGCKFITYAPESGCDKILKLIKKQINKEKMLDSIRGAVRNGLNVKCSFILGFPTETIWDVCETYVYIFRLALAGIKDVSVFPFSPYPGTELFEHFKANGQITVNDDYFKALVTGTAALPNRNSFCGSEHYSAITLRYLCMFGLGMFYTVSFIRAPVRLFRLFWNTRVASPTTRLERALSISISRRKKARLAPDASEHALI